MKLLWTMGAMLLLGLSVACSIPVSQAKGEAVTAPLYYMEGGIVARPISNGAAIPVGGNSFVELFITPYPPTPESNMDFYLYDSSNRRPITDAAVTVKYQMLYMDHGVSTLNAVSKGDGHYLAPLQLGMVGEWVADIDVAREGEQESVRLGMTLAP